MPNYRHESKARQLITEEMARHFTLPQEAVHSLAMLLETRENANRDIARIKREVAKATLSRSHE